MPLRHRHSRVSTLLIASTVMVCAFAGTAAAQLGDRVLGREDILLLGAGLAVEPARQAVPKDIATIVSTFLSAPTLPDQPLPPFAPDALVKATLRGPSFSGPVEVTTRPNTPFNIPPLSVAGIHTLDAIRLESGGEVILRGAPETVVIEVIEKLLVTQVTARALTAEEIRERGIVFDRTNFQAYNFTAAFAVGDANPIPISFPIVLPRIQSTPGVSLNEVGLPKIEVPGLPSLETIIPDTLQLQTQIPNLSVVGFTLTVPGLQGQNLMVPPIPGIVVIPGDIGFLNQYFNVTLLVGNVAPIGSGLVVTGLSAEVVLPPGRDDVPNSGDDPLRMAQTAAGESPRIQLVVQPGPDGRLGTSDDIGSLAPGDSGSAEYLVEGRREGSHVIEMEMTGTLNGLPVGPVTVRGRAAGTVLVRNPTFTLTFTHPELINAGEPYSLDITVTNTSQSPANFVSVNLYERNITGAILTGSPTRDIESIPPGDSATVSFDLIAQVTGPITAATLDSDENVEGRFALKTSVGELGIPLSPDSLVLPKEANSLPASLRNAALGLLGRAWAVATAPAAALPADVSRFSKKIVFDRAIELAEAGFRFSLHEPIAETATHLLLDYLGNNYERLSERNPLPGPLAQAQSDYRGFDELRRRSIRGEVLAEAVAANLAPELAAAGPAAFHQALGEKASFRAGHVSVLLASSSGPLPFTLSLIDATGRRIGGLDASGRVIKTIPFGDLLTFADPGAPAAQLAMIGSPAAGAYTIRLDRVDGTADTPFTLSMLVPDASGALRHVVFSGLTSESRPDPGFAPADPIRLSVDVRFGETTPAGSAVPPSFNAIVVDPAPSIIAVVQQKDADALTCEPGGPIWRAGRVIAVLFSEEVTPEAVQDRVRTSDLTRYLMEDNQVVGVALQPGRRIAFLALRDPVGPLVARTLTMSDVTDRLGQPMPAQTVPIEMTVEDEAAVVTGQVLRADGTPAAFTNVRLFYVICEPAGGQGIATRLDSSGIGISSKTTDAEGRFQWDFVLKNIALNRIAAVDIASGEARTVPFTVSRNGQRLNVNVVFLGRGTLSGRTLSETGAPLANTVVKVTSLTDDTEYGATSDAEGRFTINRIPVGNIFIEAVNATAAATGSLAEYISIANGTVTRDITLFAENSPNVDVQFGTLRGFVLRGDGQQGAPDVPVIAWYRNGSQRGVNCPAAGAECAIAVVRTNTVGEFVFDRIPAGQFRVTTFDRASYQQGEAGVILAPNTTASFNILLAQGLGTIRGVVLDATGARVPGARVGGGLSLTTTDANGEFVLVDVPVGRREIVAVSDALSSSGKAVVDLVRAGDEQNITVILDGQGSVAGRVFQSDGATPVANARVYLFKDCINTAGCIEVVGNATTDAQGGYTIAGVKLGQYKVSSFLADFSAGNVRPAPLVFAGQVARINIIFRGGGGRITGVVFDDDGQTPLAAAVGISGDRVSVAGGQVGIGFQHVDNYAVTQTSFSTGAFAFNDIWVGPVTLKAVGQFSPDPIPFETAIPSPGAEVQVELRLQGTARISGTVFQPDGVTPVGADVIVRYQSKAFKLICNGDDCQQIPQGVQNFTVVTDAQGRYLINPVNAGAFEITVEDPATGRVAQVLGETKPAQDAEFDIRLLQLATVTLRIRGSDGVTPIPGARVELLQTGFPNRAITVIAGANGDALFGGGNALAEGDFAVFATDLRNGFAGRVSGKVTAETQSLTVTLFLFDAYGRVTGTVFGPDGLTPVPNVEVLVSNEDGPLAFALTDAAGAYLADFVPLGDVFVEAFEAATSRRAFASGRVDFDNQAVPINLAQLGIGQVTGTLYQAESLTPLKNWTVYLFQAAPNGRAFPVLQTSSGVDGSFSFPGAAVGPFQIHASKFNVNAAGDAEGDIVRHGQVVDVPVVVAVPRPINGRIEGQVRNPDGSVAPNILVTVGGTGLPAALTFTTDGEGRFTVDEVPVGRLSLRAQSQVSRNAASIYADLQFEGETLQPTIVLVGLTQITGTVFRSDGVTPASFVAVELRGDPSSGCESGACHANADAAGRFAFDDVPARTFTVIAIDAIAELKGVAGDAVNPGGTRDVRIVLEPSATLTGRARFPGNLPAQGVVVEVVIPRTAPEPDLHLFAVSEADGAFTFPAVPSGLRTFSFNDPIGPGVATRIVQVLNGAQSIGDVVLDVGPPTVASTSPPLSAVGVPLNAVIRLVFSEPLAPGSVTQANVMLTHAGGSVSALLSVDEGDTRVTLTPIAPLLEKTLYTVAVRNVTDRIGKPMTLPFITGFTSVDLTPPTVSALSPGAGTNGAPIYAPIRVTYAEPVDVTRFTGAPLTLFDGAIAVEGRTDFLFGNTVVVFTPTRPLREDATYRVAGQAAVDLSGNAQAQGPDYTFTTTDRTPPVITALVPAGNGTVIENAVTQVMAQVSAGHDVAFVDFYVNGILTSTSRSEPFTLNLLARAELGAPGSAITVAAIATDTSGNRGTAPVSASVTIIADTAPVVSIVSPAPDAPFRNGERVNVTVRVSDDLGATQFGYRAETGRPQDAATSVIDPPALSREETFGFNVPATASPGSRLRITASVIDTKGQASVVDISLVILDAVPPTVTITGTTTGSRVRPGQDTLVIVSAQDAGSIRELSFEATGVVARSEVRVVDPAQPDVATSFTIHVPETAGAGDLIVLNARAVDVAGNTTNAAPVTLPVADLNAPTVTLRTENGLLQAVPGRTLTVIVNAEDETGVARVDLTGQGAFALTDARAISPPIASAVATFTINVPASAVPGSTLTLAATATDLFGNVSQPGTLALTVQAVAGVTMPASLLTLAGGETEVVIELAEPAPAGGTVVTLLSTNPNVVTAVTPVTFVEGTASGTARIISIAGGNATINAFIQGVQRAGMTVTVQGGVVRGTVFDPDGLPVSGAQVSVTSPLRVTTTDENGEYLVQGIGTGGSGLVVVKVLDPVTRFIGYASGQLNVPNGSARLNAVLIAAGRIGGTVVLQDGETVAGAGARVDLFAPNNLNLPLQTVFTNEDGQYEFPLVTLGTYRVDASDTNGNRGRATAALGQSGDEIVVAVQYLGRGVVTGTVRSGGNPAPNAAITFSSTSLFGSGPYLTRNAEADGTFRFEGVLIGSFTVQAHDPVSNTAGTASGQIALHEQTVTADVTLANYGGLTGRVFRSDGVTPVAGASVRVNAQGASIITSSDENGFYTFLFVPLGGYTIDASEFATRGLARVSGTLTTHLQVDTRDLTFLAQGSIVATVFDFNGLRVPGAQVSVSSQNGSISDGFSVNTDENGVAIFEHVLIGTVRLNAYGSGLTSPQVTVLLGDGEVLNVSLTLEPTANIVGTLFGPDGQTPMIGGFVSLNSQGYALRPVAADGTFRFDGLDFGSYHIHGHDPSGRWRATVANIVLNQNGVDVVRDITLIGLGSVIGQVLNPDGSPAGNRTVTVRGLHPTFGGFYTDATDANGNYEVMARVAIGGFAVTVGSGSLLGEGAGSIAFDGETVRRDIVLTNSAVTLPVTLRDANNATWEVRQGGQVGPSLFSMFVAGGTAAAPQGGFVLEIVSGATPTTFVGDTTFGTTEDGSREIAVRQQTTPIAGLSVTRKAFVPYSHFGRYLELLTNPTAAPITVDVRIRSTMATTSTIAPALARTSSGDAIIDVSTPETADRWAVVRMGADGDVFQSSSFRPSVAWVFDGPGAARRASAVTLQTTNPKTFVYTWSSVTIDPGQTVGFLHFGAQQYNQAAAIASAERLVQLPPEALAGLSPDEIASIQNFAVPMDGISTLEALPGFGTSITGRVLEADGATAMVAGASIRLHSSLIYFGRQYSATANATGSFTFTATPGTSTQMSLPLADFTLDATYSGTNLVSPFMTGQFEAGTLTATRDIIFTNGAIVGGVVRRHTGAVVTTGGTIRINNVGGASVSQTVNLAADGRFRFNGVPAGNYTLTPILNVLPGGNAGDVRLTATATTSTTAGQTVEQDVFIGPTGGLTGTLRTAAGAVVPNRTVNLRVGVSTHRTVTSSTAGVFLFTDVPVGSYVLRSQDPVTSFFAEVNVAILQDQTLAQDLTFIGVGTVPVTVTSSDGLLLANAPIRIHRSTDAVNAAPTSVGSTDAAGQFTITNVPLGDFLVRAQHPLSSSLTVEVTGTMPAAGDAVPISAVLPAVSSLLVQVRTAAGDPVSGATVRISRNGSSFSSAGTTDSAGDRTVTAAWGNWRVRVDHPILGSSLSVEAEGTITVSNQTITVPITMPVTSRIVGTVRDASGVPVGFTFVQFRSQDYDFYDDAETDENGQYEIAGLPPGPFRAYAFDYESDPERPGSASGVVVAQGELQVDIVLDDVLLPTTLTDGNNRAWEINYGGQIESDLSEERYPFTIETQGSTSAFRSWSDAAEDELDRRQLAIWDMNIETGLDAARKVYVPADGYFLRYLDIVENHDSVARTVTVSGSDENLAEFSHAVQATSSGDLTVGTDDRWWVTGVTQTGGVGRAFAHVLVGAGGGVGLAAATAPLTSTSYTWDSVTLQPGERAALLHFVVQSRSVTAAQGAAERLVQLPPEALAGLTADELALIRNFDAPDDGQSTIAPFPAFSGTVFAGDGITPVGGVTVTVASPNPFRDSVGIGVTDINGRYSIAYPAVDGYTLSVGDQVSGSPAVFTGTVAPGDTAIVRDVVLTTLGGLRGTVRQAGVAVASGEVRVRRQSNAVVTTVAIRPDGLYLLGGLVPGTYDVLAVSGGQASVATQVTVQQGVTTNQNIDLTLLAGTVSVEILAADATTEMPAGVVSIHDPVTAQVLIDQLLPGADGTYTSTAFAAPNGFVVRARTPLSNGSFVDTESSQGPYTTAGQAVTVTMVTTASVVRVTVSDYFDPDWCNPDDPCSPESVAGATVRVRQLRPDGSVDSFEGLPTSSSGRSWLFGIQPGPFVVQVIDAAPGILTTEVTASLDGPSALLNVTMPSGGFVFVDTDGEGSVITLTSNGSLPGVYASQAVNATIGGAYFFRLPPGPFAVQVCQEEAPLLCSAANGVAIPDGFVSISLQPPLPIPGGFAGSLVAADGVTPVPNAPVLVAAGEATPIGGFESYTTNESGQFQSTAPFVTLGLNVASTGPASAALVTQTATLESPLTFTLVGDSGIDASLNTLTGSLSFRYDFGCDGSVAGGAEPQTPGAFEWYNGLRLNGLGLHCHLAAGIELDGRQVAYAPITIGGLQVTRKVYVPEDGSYVRYLEILTNPQVGSTLVPITAELQLDGQLAEPLRVVRSTTETGGAYFVADDGGSIANRTVMAGVLSANTGAATLFPSVRMQQMGGYTSTRYTVTVPDGQTRILMHFVVQRSAGDLAGAEAQAQSLVTLTDPNMFFGLSEAERAQVLNFRAQ